MGFKDLLLFLTTYPEPTPVSAVETAVDIAVALESKLSAIACAVSLHVPPNIYGKVLLDVPAMAAGEARKSLRNANSAQEESSRTGYKRIARYQRLPSCLSTMRVFETLQSYRRPRPGPFEPRYAESIIFGSGRPTLVIPNARADARVFALDTVVVAWDFSRPAARAVGDALPLLEKAKQVYVVTVTNEKAISIGRSGPEPAKHLARHGANVVLDIVDAAGRTIGDVLESYVSSRNANLLVMGTYGHSRVREFVLRGCNQERHF
jgi:nucleotide-binding universal stress UspA family protein